MRSVLILERGEILKCFVFYTENNLMLYKATDSRW